MANERQVRRLASALSHGSRTESPWHQHIQAEHGELDDEHLRAMVVEDTREDEGRAASPSANSCGRDNGSGTEGTKTRSEEEIEDVAVLRRTLEHARIRIRIP